MTVPPPSGRAKTVGSAIRRDWLARYGLPIKLVLPLLGAVLVLSVLSSVALGWLLDAVHVREAQERAERFGALVNDELRSETAEGHGAMRTLLQSLCRAADEETFVTDAQGRVQLACAPDLVGSRIELEGELPLEVVGHGSARWARWLQPVRGEAECVGCHGPAQTLGWIGVDVPLTALDAEVHEQQRANLIVGVALMVTIAVLFVVVQIVLVYRPVKRLTEAVDRIRAGDLAARLPDSPADELGRLAHSVNEMAVSLERAKRELERTHRAELAQSEKLAALGQVFTSVAHEIKNELTGIVGALREVEQDLPDAVEGKPMVAKILAQMERMSRTSVSALDFARPRAVASASVDLAELLDRTLFFLEREAVERGVELRKTYARELPRAAVDEDLLKEVLLNILLNGVQAMPEGGVLDVQTRAAGEHAVEVVISDQGRGIPPEHRKAIFTPFFTTKARGTGLGLYIAHKIVQAHRGEITVEARPEGGTSFIVRLPSAPGADGGETHDAS